MTGYPLHPLRSDKIAGLKGDVAIPGDKSISHRALMLSSQVLGTTKITGLLEGEDVLNTAKAMQALGVTVIRHAGHGWTVKGAGVGGLSESPQVLDMGNSGTSTRLLMGLVTPYPFTTFFTGDASLSKRPMKRVITPLMQMGANFTSHHGDCLPIALTGSANTIPITYTLPVASAQVKSAVLLAGLNTPGQTTVIEKEATRDHTENMLRHFGFDISSSSIEEGIAITVTGQQIIPFAEREIDVPGDPSSAAFLIVAALICPNSNIIIRNVCINPLRIGLLVTLREMGAKIEYKNERIVAGEKIADIAVAASQLKAIDVPAERAPSQIDEYPVLAVAAAFAEGETVMHGLSELRVKESDRLAAILAALTACGVKARAEGDTLYVTGGTVSGGATVTTHYDHRIAMAFLVMGMAAEKPVIVDDATAIRTSFPNFMELMNSLGSKITGLPDDRMPKAVSNHPIIRSSGHPLTIAIDGPAASGKGTLARRLAEHFGLDYLDTGSLYRAVGLKLVYGDKDPSDVKAALHAANTIDADDLANPRLRQERIGKAASVVSAYPEVREALLQFQRNFAQGKLHSSPIRGGDGWGAQSGAGAKLSPHPNLPPNGEGTFRGAVLDGRDIGTVVCPEADFKFFITATMEERAQRRHRELQGEGIEVIYESVLDDLRERDERDSKRKAAPLIPADDAVILDTSKLDADAVFEKACQLIVEKYPALVA